MTCEECGVEIIINRSRDRKKRYCTRQCWLKVMRRSGLIRYPTTTAGRPTHGYSRTPEYTAWQRAKRRCQQHPHYVRNGVKMATEWIDDPAAFVVYVLNHLGPHPGKGWSLDRINNERGYEPGNLRWATVVQQRRNQRRWIERHR